MKTHKTSIDLEIWPQLFQFMGRSLTALTQFLPIIDQVPTPGWHWWKEFLYCIKGIPVSSWHFYYHLPHAVNVVKVGKILKGSLDLISSPSPLVKIQIIGGKVFLRCKGKILLGDVNKLFVFKSLLKTPSNVLPQANFLPIIRIFNESEGDEIKSRLPFKIFSTLITKISTSKITYVFFLIYQVNLS